MQVHLRAFCLFKSNAFLRSRYRRRRRILKSLMTWQKPETAHEKSPAHGTQPACLVPNR